MGGDTSLSATGRRNDCTPRSPARALGLVTALLALALLWATLAASVARAEEGAPTNTAPPTISGEGASELPAPIPAVEGITLTATSGSWSGAEPIAYSYQWLSCDTEGEGGECAEIAGATTSTYTPRAGVLGRSLRVRVTASNSADPEGVAATSARTSEVRSAGGDVASWGSNKVGQLSAGYRDLWEDKPVPAVALAGVTQLSGGMEFALGLLDNGTVRSWGRNGQGQAGDGERGEHLLRPNVAVAGLEGAEQLEHAKAVAAADAHAMALQEEGTVDVWGSGDLGELGNGIHEKVKKANGEEFEICGIGSKSELREGETLPRAHPDAPVQVPGLEGATAIAAGGDADYALLKTGEVMAWGRAGHGQTGTGEIPAIECYEYLGHNAAPAVLSPEKVKVAVTNEHGERELTPLTNVAAIAAGNDAAYALLDNGEVMSWGDNANGELGAGLHLPEKEDYRDTAVMVKNAKTGKPLEGVKAITAGLTTALALLEDGEVWGWGIAGPMLGERSETEPPEECKKKECFDMARPLKGLEGVKAKSIAVGENYSLVASEGGEVYAFGKNEHGQLGDGTTETTSEPTLIAGLTGVASVDAGEGDSKEHTISQSLALLEPGASPPPARLSVESQARALKLAWTIHSGEYKIEYNPANIAELEECSQLEGEEQEACEEAQEARQQKEEEEKKYLGLYKLGGETTSFTLGEGGRGPKGETLPPLEVRPYVITFKTPGSPIKKRTIVAEPLL